MKKKTNEEIDKQVDIIKRLRAVMPQFSHFGDNNWEKMDRQILLLGNLKDKSLDHILKRERVGDDTEYEVCSWLSGSLVDDLAEEGDVAAFQKKANP